eukprot:5575016-Prymnesium_polylepis.1
MRSSTAIGHAWARSSAAGARATRTSKAASSGSGTGAGALSSQSCQSLRPGLPVVPEPRPRIYATDLVGGHTGVDQPRAGSARPRLVEWPTMAELNAMPREQIASLRFTAIGWKARGPTSLE